MGGLGTDTIAWEGKMTPFSLGEGHDGKKKAQDGRSWELGKRGGREEITGEVFLICVKKKWGKETEGGMFRPN